jgi:hypothetical protein
MRGLSVPVRIYIGATCERARLPEKKNDETSVWRNLFLKSASMSLEGKESAQKIQESVFKKFENAFIYEILYLQLEVSSRHLLI